MLSRRRKLTLSDYKELISLKGGRGKRRWRKRAVKGSGKMSHLPEAMMLVHMMSKTNKNAKQ